MLFDFSWCCIDLNVAVAIRYHRIISAENNVKRSVVFDIIFDTIADFLLVIDSVIGGIAIDAFSRQYLSGQAGMG